MERDKSSFPVNFLIPALSLNVLTNGYQSLSAVEKPPGIFILNPFFSITEFFEFKALYADRTAILLKIATGGEINIKMAIMAGRSFFVDFIIINTSIP